MLQTMHKLPTSEKDRLRSFRTGEIVFFDTGHSHINYIFISQKSGFITTHSMLPQIYNMCSFNKNYFLKLIFSRQLERHNGLFPGKNKSLSLP